MFAHLSELRPPFRTSDTPDPKQAHQQALLPPKNRCSPPSALLRTSTAIPTSHRRWGTEHCRSGCPVGRHQGTLRLHNGSWMPGCASSTPTRRASTPAFAMIASTSIGSSRSNVRARSSNSGAGRGAGRRCARKCTTHLYPGEVYWQRAKGCGSVWGRRLTGNWRAIGGQSSRFTGIRLLVQRVRQGDPVPLGPLIGVLDTPAPRATCGPVRVRVRVRSVLGVAAAHCSASRHHAAVCRTTVDTSGFQRRARGRRSREARPRRVATAGRWQRKREATPQTRLRR